MSQQTYVRVSGIIFMVVALTHAMRLGGKWDLVIAGWSVPEWPSVLAVIVSGYLAYVAFRRLDSKNI